MVRAIRGLVIRATPLRKCRGAHALLVEEADVEPDAVFHGAVRGADAVAELHGLFLARGRLAVAVADRRHHLKIPFEAVLAEGVDVC
jgi:hypothetical protein